MGLFGCNFVGFLAIVKSTMAAKSALFRLPAEAMLRSAKAGSKIPHNTFINKNLNSLLISIFFKLQLFRKPKFLLL